MNHSELINKSRDIMSSLVQQTSQTVGLGVFLPDESKGLVLTAIKGTSGVAYHIDPGYHFPLHTSAPGKILLAYMPKKKRNKIISQMDFQPYTPSTITDRKIFQAELDAVAEKGYSIDVSEQLEGCHCVGVPIFDETRQVTASLWTTGPSSLLPVRRFPEISEIMKKGATELSQRLRSAGRTPGRIYVLNVVEQAREILNTRTEQSVDIEELARNLYVSYPWFRKNFKEQTGMAPAEFHQHARMTRAQELLLNSDASVRQIAEELGFQNQNHFSALFKRKFELSPAIWREKNAPNP